MQHLFQRGFWSMPCCPHHPQTVRSQSVCVSLQKYSRLENNRVSPLIFSICRVFAGARCCYNNVSIYLGLFLTLQLVGPLMYFLRTKRHHWIPEHVSGAWAADFPLIAQAYFCDTRSPLRSRSAALPLPLSSRSPDFPPAPLTLRSNHML